jgi:hypothetical protein
MAKKGQWHDYENGKKKEYGEFGRKAGFQRRLKSCQSIGTATI